MSKTNHRRLWGYSWAAHTPMLPRRLRQMDYLERAARVDAQQHPFIKGIVLHREGGTAFNHDLRDLVRRGLLKMVRNRYSTGWGGNYDLRVSCLEITAAGAAALARGRIA